jgi:hypothetical protein
MRLAAIDNGYWQTKSLIDKKLSLIRSRVSKDPDGNFEFDDEKYTIGQGNISIDHNKTENELNRIVTYYLLSRAICDKDMFQLVVSLPMLRYKGFADNYKDYIRQSGLIATRLNGKKKIIVIDDIYVFLQGVSAIYAEDPNKYKNKLIHVIDAGGLTIQGCAIENRRPVKESFWCIDAGVIMLQQKIKNHLNEKYDLNLQDYEIPYLPEKYADDVAEIKYEHMSIIKTEMQKANWNVNDAEILATGGGSKVLNIPSYFNNCTLSPDPIYDNVKGLFKAGQVKFPCAK